MASVRIPIATRLGLGFLLVIFTITAVFVAAGIRLISDRIVTEAQEKVTHDLNAAREIYLGKLGQVSDVVRLTADRYVFKDALLSGRVERATRDIAGVMAREGLDFLAVTDTRGVVRLRAGDSAGSGDDRSGNDLVRTALMTRTPAAATDLLSADQLRCESEGLAQRAYVQFVPTPKARPRPETEETSGMALAAAAPIFDYQGGLLGALYGGVLLNRDYELVDRVKQTVYQDIQYRDKDIGTATIFQDDVRISTNVRNQDGTRAIGTRMAEDVYQRVVEGGRPWIGRAYVVNDWYITAYEPIRDLAGKTVGVLYVGLLEERYVDAKRQSVLIFVTIALAGMMVATGVSYLLARRMSSSIRRLTSVSREISRGNLDARVDLSRGGDDELRDLGATFNLMADALRERDRQIKEYARKKIMESERLALIGQLAAGVAHELNNPLQGIVAYSHLLLERMPAEETARGPLQKIVAQSDRARKIIRDLLDFSRQRKPHKTLCDVNAVIEGCLSLLENQALLQDVELVRNFDPQLPKVIVDRSQLEQVFLNMIINAAEALDRKGRLTLATRFDRGEGHVEAEFTDTGRGIARENLERIFDPFFTTKEAGHGTGLGLAISFGIVKEHQGTITVESELGKGTTFLVSLPVAEQEAEIASREA